MRRARVAIPQISPLLSRLFGAYLEWYLRRNFHAVRVSGASYAEVPASRPVVICLNHPAWWDPLIALTIASRLFPDRKHYGPIESRALSKYRFFERLGFFGIDPDTASGAAVFLRTGGAILSRSDSALWITAQGQFTDPRVRPVSLRAGTGHLLIRAKNVTVLPLAVEYPFWEERFPEVLVRFGEPIHVEDGRTCSPQEWTKQVSFNLERAQDLLAVQSIARDRRAFHVLATGRTGAGVYDLWRALKSIVRRQEFHSAHGPERL